MIVRQGIKKRIASHKPAAPLLCCLSFSQSTDFSQQDCDQHTPQIVSPVNRIQPAGFRSVHKAVDRTQSQIYLVNSGPMLTGQTSAGNYQQSTVDRVPEFAAGVLVASPLDLSEDVTEFGSVVVVQDQNIPQGACPATDQSKNRSRLRGRRLLFYLKDQLQSMWTH
jgi:hypothetical protein